MEEGGLSGGEAMSVAIMVIEDEPAIRELLARYLERDGFSVSSFCAVEPAREALPTVAPDLVVLDIMLPGQDGLSFCRELRSESNVPVIIVSARGEEIDRIVGLEFGADDYLAKPFSPRELVARVRAVLRRASPPSCRDEIAIQDVTVFRGQRRAAGPGGDLGLTNKEFSVLELLFSHPDQAFSRAQLLDRVWNFDFVGDTRAVDDVVKRIRKKLRAAGCLLDITTVWGHGYKVQSGGASGGA